MESKNLGELTTEQAPISEPSTKKIIKDILWLSIPNSLTYFLEYAGLMYSLYYMTTVCQGNFNIIALGNIWFYLSAFVLLFGACAAIDAFAPQLVGKMDLKECGNVYYRGAFLLFFACIPFSIFLCYGSCCLKFAGIDPKTADFAVEYATYLIPCLFITIQYELLVRFLNAQGIACPITFITILTTILQVVCCHYLVQWTPERSYLGGAIARNIASTLGLMLLLLYVKVSGCAKESLEPITMNGVFSDVKPFAKAAAIGATFSYLDSCAFALISIVAAVLGEQDFNVSAKYLHINLLLFMVPVGFGRAACAHVGTYLGKNEHRTAKSYYKIGSKVNLLVSIIVAIVFFFNRKLVANCFSIKGESLQTFMKIGILFSIMFPIDTLQGYNSRVLMGMNRLNLTTIAVIGAYYIAMLPNIYYLTYVKGVGLFGLWIPNLLASVSLACATCSVISRLFKEKEAEEVKTD